MNENEIARSENLEMAVMPSVGEMIFDDLKFQRMNQLAEIMAGSTCTIPKHLQGKPGDCFAIIAQASQWRMNPFVVAQKTHIVNGALGYEAQLINAVITSMNVISGRFHYEYVGDWEGYRKASFMKAKEAGCGVNVGAVIKGESEITWMPMPLYMESVVTRNSPLWKTNPQQQLAYLAVKYWVRLFAPDALLGVYSDDELAVTEDIPGQVSAATVAGNNKKTGTKKDALKSKLGINPEEAVNVEVVEEEPQPKVSERVQAIIDMTGAPVTVDEVVSYLQSLGYCTDYGLDEIEKYPENFRNRMAGDLTNLVNQAAEFANK
jgi:hypothetical protein